MLSTLILLTCLGQLTQEVQRNLSFPNRITISCLAIHLGWCKPSSSTGILDLQ